jgi:putative flavoprotein involved in K+ transport
VSDVPGLYFVGIPWQYTRGSALLGFVQDDAAFIAARIDAFAAQDTADELTTTLV